MRETFPDQVLGDADEVVLIDLTPQALIARLQAGKIYPPERVPAALTNFFKVENLMALREVALRQVAEDVESKRLVFEELDDRDDDRLAAHAPVAVGERLRALASARPSSLRLVRVASALGAHVLVEEGHDVSETVARVARERRTTYVLIGEPRSAKGLRRLGISLPEKLLERLPAVYIATVPLALNIEAPVPEEWALALPMLEAIERRAARLDVPVEARIEPERSPRHALRRLVEHETFDRVVIPASGSRAGFSADDIAWLLENLPGEIVVLRPAGQEHAGGRLRTLASPPRGTRSPRSRTPASMRR